MRIAKMYIAITGIIAPWVSQLPALVWPVVTTNTFAVLRSMIVWFFGSGNPGIDNAGTLECSL